LVPGNDRGQARQAAGLVGDRDLEPAGVGAAAVAADRVPADVDPAFGRLAEAFQRGAVDGVDGDALARGDDADDAVARQRVAAAREVHRHARDQALDGDLAGLLLVRPVAFGRLVAGAAVARAA